MGNIGDGSQSPGSQNQNSSESKKLARVSSFAGIRDSVMWLGEQAQTQFLDRNLEAHIKSALDDDETTANSSFCGIRPVSSNPSITRSIFSSGSMTHPPSYNSIDQNHQLQTIRFQVIVWSIGCPDVKNDKVLMKFRVTLFWNDDQNSSSSNEIDNGDNTEASNEVKTSTTSKKKPKTRSIWAMAGRNAAHKKKISETPSDTIDIPPISILNADSFKVVGQPEVQIIRENANDGTRLMRWSCMYRAQLHQRDMRVHDFPHDTHDLCLKLGILSQRQPGGRWDRRKWKLGLANQGDTQGSISVPCGLVVDHVEIPEFEADKAGLVFELSELKHGHAEDHCLNVKLKVKRNSGYYDNNIMPLLSVLNLVSISILALYSENYFQRSLMALKIAFVEVGLRLSFESHLPCVGYQIKLQRILNSFFYSILSIVLESSVLKLFIEMGVCSVASTRKIDFVWALFLLSNQVYLQLLYIDTSSDG